MNIEETAEKMRNWTEQARNLQSRAGEMARTVGSATDRCVHEHIWATVGIAALVGCVVGYTLANGRCRR